MRGAVTASCCPDGGCRVVPPLTASVPLHLWALLLQASSLPGAALCQALWGSCCPPWRSLLCGSRCFHTIISWLAEFGASAGIPRRIKQGSAHTPANPPVHGVPESRSLFHSGLSRSLQQVLEMHSQILILTEHSTACRAIHIYRLFHWTPKQPSKDSGIFHLLLGLHVSPGLPNHGAPATSLGTHCTKPDLWHPGGHFH